MAKKTVERNVWIAAPRQRVWQAISQPEQLAQWFLPVALGGQMKLSDDGVLSVSMGPMEMPIALVEDVTPMERLTSRSLPDRVMTTTYVLADDDGGTRVTVTTRGFEALPEGARQERLDPTGAGWEKALQNLKAFVDGSETPFPEGWVSAMFGYRLESSDKIGVLRSIWINAPRERVWRALTVMDEMEQWFSPGTPWTLTEAAVGGRMFVRDAESGAALYAQVIDIYDPPSRLVTRSVPEPPDVPHTSDWRLEAVDGGTRLTILYTGYELEPAEARHNNMEQNAFGFGMMLENLRVHIEGGEMPMPGGF